MCTILTRDFLDVTTTHTNLPEKEIENKYIKNVKNYWRQKPSAIPSSNQKASNEMFPRQCISFINGGSKFGKKYC